MNNVFLSDIHIVFVMTSKVLFLNNHLYHFLNVLLHKREELKNTLGKCNIQEHTRIDNTLSRLKSYFI